MESEISPAPQLGLSTTLASIPPPAQTDFRGNDKLTSNVTGMRTKASVPPPLRRSIRGGVAILGLGFRGLW